MLNILLPSLPYQRVIDPMWQEELETAQRLGHTVCLFDAEREKLYQQPNAQWPTLYRGWMLAAEEYQQLEKLTPLLVPVEMYLSSHQATGWHELIPDFTPSSRFVKADVALETVDALLKREGKCFIKGRSKSFEADSIIQSVNEYADLLKKHDVGSDEILFIRDFVKLSSQPEQRFFAVRDRVFGANGSEFPAELRPVLVALESRWFYTIDVAYQADGKPIVIEIGDGQVSDVKEWTVAELYETAISHLSGVSTVK